MTLRWRSEGHFHFVEDGLVAVAVVAVVVMSVGHQKGGETAEHQPGEMSHISRGPAMGCCEVGDVRVEHSNGARSVGAGEGSSGVHPDIEASPWASPFRLP